MATGGNGPTSSGLQYAVSEVINGNGFQQLGSMHPCMLGTHARMHTCMLLLTYMITRRLSKHLTFEQKKQFCGTAFTIVGATIQLLKKLTCWVGTTTIRAMALSDLSFGLRMATSSIFQEVRR